MKVTLQRHVAINPAVSRNGKAGHRKRSIAELALVALVSLPSARKLLPPICAFLGATLGSRHGPIRALGAPAALLFRTRLPPTLSALGRCVTSIRASPCDDPLALCATRTICLPAGLHPIALFLAKCFTLFFCKALSGVRSEAPSEGLSEALLAGKLEAPRSAAASGLDSVR